MWRKLKFVFFQRLEKHVVIYNIVIYFIISFKYYFNKRIFLFNEIILYSKALFRTEYFYKRMKKTYILPI